MATTAAEILVKVIADTETAQRKLNGMSKEFDTLRAGASKMALGLTVAVAAAGAGVVAFTTAGSDLAESQNKMNVVFGQSATAIEQWASSANTAMGMTKQAAIDNAGAMGNLFSQLGIAQQKSAEMSQGLVQLAADLASFHNAAGGASEVMEAMSASFRGEYDAMQRYIPTLSAAAVEHQALAMTGKATTDQLTAMDKALATQAIMLQDAGAAVGDFARTSDGWANQNRILKATLENLTAEIGTKLLPVLTPYLQALTDYITDVGPKFVEAVSNAVVTLQSLSDTVKQFDYAPLINGLSETGVRATTLSEQIAGFLANLAAWGDAIFGFFGDQLRLAGEQVGAFGDLLTGRINWEEFKTRLDGVAESGGRVWQQFGGLMGEITANVGKFDEQVAGLTAVSQANFEATDWWQRHGAALQTFNEDAAIASSALWSMADVWSQAYEAIQNTTLTSLDTSRNKVLETFDAMAQDYAQHATTIVDLEDRKGQMVAYLEAVYQEQAGALQAAGQQAQLADLTQAHQAKLRAVLASYNTQIALEKTGQTALLSNAKQYYVVTLRVMAQALSAQVSAFRSNMTALVRMAVSGYGSAAAAAMAFNKAAAGAKTIGELTAAMDAVMDAMNAIEGAGLAAIDEASSGFENWQNAIDDVATGLEDVGDQLGSITSGGSRGGGGGGGASSGIQRQLIDPMQAAAQTVQGLATMVEKAIAAFNQLASWGGPQAGWVDKFNALASALQTVTFRWRDVVMALNFDVATYDNLKKFAEGAGAAVKLVGDAVGSLMKLSDYDASLDILNAGVVKLVADVRMITQMIVWNMALYFNVDELATLKQFSENAGAAVKLVGDAAGALMKLKDYDATFDLVAAGIMKLVADVRMIAQMLFWNMALYFDADAMAEVKKFADGAGGAMKLVGDAVSALMKLKDYDASFDLIAAGLMKLVADVRLITQMMVWQMALYFNDDTIAMAKKFAEGAGAAVKLVGDAVSSLMKIKEYDSSFDLVAAGVMKMVADIRYITRMLVWQMALYFDAETIGMAKQFAENAGAAVKLVGDAVGSLMKLKEYDASLDVTTIVDRLLEQVKTLVQKFIDAAKGFDNDAAAAAAAFAQSAGTIAGILATLVSGFEAVAKYKPESIGTNLDLLFGKLRALVQKFIDAAKGFDNDATAAAAAFAQSAGTIAGILSTLVSAFEAVARYKPESIGTKLDLLFGKLQATIQKFLDAAKGFDNDATAAAAAFAQSVGSIVGLLSTLVSAFDAVAKYKPKSIGSKLDLLFGKLKATIQKFLDTAKGFDADATAAAAAFAQSAGTIAGILSTLVAAFEAVARYKPESIGTKLDLLFGKLKAMIQKFLDTAKGFDADAMAAAAVFAEAVQSMLTMLSSALDLLTSLRKYVAPPANAVAAFERDVEDILLRFSRWVVFVLQPIAQDIEDETMQALQSMVTGLRDAVDVLVAITDYVSPGEKAIADFEKDYQKIFRDWLTWANTTFTSLNTEIVNAIAAIFDDVYTGLDKAVAALEAIIDYVSPGETAIADFERDYQRVFNNWITWANTTFTDLNIEIVGAIADIFDDVYTGLGEAIKTLEAIIDYVSPSETAIANFETDYRRIFGNWLTWANTTFIDVNMEIVGAIADIFDDVYSGLGEAVATLKAITDYVSPSETAIANFETDYQRVFRNWLTWANTTFTDLNLEIVGAIASIFDDVYTGLGEAVTTLQALVDYVSPSETAIANFETDYQRVFRNWLIWANTTFTDINLEIVTAIADIFDDVYTGLGEAVTTLEDLIDYVSPAETSIATFETDYQRVFNNWLNWANVTFTDLNLDIVTTIAGIFDDVFTGLDAAVTTLENLVDYVSPSEISIAAFETDYQRVFNNWLTWVNTTFTNINLEIVGAIADIFGNVFTGLDAAVTTLENLIDYVSPSEISIAAFETDYQRVFNNWLTWANTTFTDINLDVIGAIAEAFDNVYSGLGEAVTTLEDLVDYVSPSETAIADFERDYQRIAEDFRDWAIAEWTPATAAAAKAVGDAVDALYGGLGTAATTLSLIRNYTPPSQAAINQFIADMTSIISTMLTWVQENFDPDAQELMRTFGNTIDVLFRGIGTALDVLAGIADYTVTNSEFQLALQRFNANLLTAITSWQIWLLNVFTPETAALVRQFTGIMNDIVSSMRAALNLLMDIEEANLPTSEELEAFLTSIARLFSGVLDIFEEVAADVDGLVDMMHTSLSDMLTMITDEITAFAPNLEDTFDDMFDTLYDDVYDAGAWAGWRFLDGLLVGMSNIQRQNAVTAAMRDLADQLEAELRLAWGISSPSKVAERIGGYFVTGLALGLRDLATIPTLIQNSLSMDPMTLGADVRYSPAPRHDYLTIQFEGAWQSGMSPQEEQRITQAMVSELRRQSLALQVARV